MTLNPVASDAHFSHEPDAGAAAAPFRTSARTVQREAIDSHALLRGQRELLIRHGEHEYRLRLTQNDKLILTK